MVAGGTPAGGCSKSEMLKSGMSRRWEWKCGRAMGSWCWRVASVGAKVEEASRRVFRLSSAAFSRLWGLAGGALLNGFFGCPTFAFGFGLSSLILMFKVATSTASAKSGMPKMLKRGPS